MTEPGASVIRVETADDRRIAAYRNLKDRELARDGGQFVAEGEFVVRRLLASDFPVESVLVAERLAAEIAPLVRPGVPVYAATAAVMSGIVGYAFHQGVLACGRRKQLQTIDELCSGWGESDTGGAGAAPRTLAVLPEVISAENLGSLLRLSAGFGVDGVVLGPRCCDPFYRQAVRVSMGTVFRLPLVRSLDLAADLRRLRDRWQVQLAATVLEESAEPLTGAMRPRRLALLFGNEAQGLPEELLALCQRRLTIPMKLGTDSLNVAVAAGIFLYHFSSAAVIERHGER